MTNNEARMTKQIRMTHDEKWSIARSSFGIRH
jgi:hypothetical protein